MCTRFYQLLSQQWGKHAEVEARHAREVVRAVEGATIPTGAENNTEVSGIIIKTVGSANQSLLVDTMGVLRVIIGKMGTVAIRDRPRTCFRCGYTGASSQAMP